MKNNLEKGLRIDAELYRKDFVFFEKTIKNIKYSKLKDEVKLIKKGIFDIKSNCYTDKGVPFVRISNLKKQVIDMNDIIYIPECENIKNLNTFLGRNDIIVSKTANAAASLVNIPFCNTSQDTVAIKLKDDSLLNSHFLVVYLNTKYGIQQMQRWFTGNIQMHLNLEDCKENLLIPIYRNTFQRSIKKIFEDSIQKVVSANDLYAQAESLLLESIDLKDFNPSKEPVNIKSFKTSYSKTGRLDAEYYQKKYDIIEKTFDNFKRIKISDLVNYPISSGITPKAGGEDYTDPENGIPFIRAVDLQNGEVSTANFNYIKKTIHNGILKRTQLKENDVLFSIAGTVGRTAIFKYSFDANINQAVSILRFDENLLLRLYLVLFFNSSIGKEFISKYSRQGLQTNLNLNEVGELSIPIIDYKIQQQIAGLVEESFRLKAESERLLEVAKKAVEMAIEEGEGKAMEFIENNFE